MSALGAASLAIGQRNVRLVSLFQAQKTFELSTRFPFRTKDTSLRLMSSGSRGAVAEGEEEEVVESRMGIGLELETSTKTGSDPSSLATSAVNQAIMLGTAELRLESSRQHESCKSNQ